MAYIEIPEKAEWILKVLQENGHEAYIVGGCVRDSIMGRTPEDWDVTTSASPQQVKALFPKTIDTGIEHGTVTVMIEKEGFEVTTYRIDGAYEDNRHPKDVVFTSSLLEDLKRRDFTINAMAYSPAAGLVDEFGGGRTERAVWRRRPADDAGRPVCRAAWLYSGRQRARRDPGDGGRSGQYQRRAYPGRAGENPGFPEPSLVPAGI